MTFLCGLLVLAAAIYAILKKIDVRLVLLLAAFALAVSAGLGHVGGIGLAAAPMQIVRTFLSTFSNEKFVVPICSAMGFAFVLKETQCDQHLVHLLMKPFQRLRPLLVPGTVLVAFAVNVPLISQTSTAVAVGTVMVPLLRAAGVSPLTIGAALVLGSSLGGELLNRAAPELRTVAEALKPHFPQSSSQDCVVRVLPLIWVNLLVAASGLWLLCWWRDRRLAESVGANETEPAFRVNPIKALVPFVPLAVLFVTAPPFTLLKIPDDWLVKPADAAARDSRSIGAAMLVGVLAAGLTTPPAFKTSVKSFFEGAGYGFTHIIALIVTASCFGEGIKLIGIDRELGRLIASRSDLLIPLAAAVPLAFGTLSGSGMAATQSLYEFFVEPSLASGADPFRVGAVVSIAAATGRTISPVAAVTLMVAKMTDVDAFAIARRVALPALAALVATVTWAMLRQ